MAQIPKGRQVKGLYKQICRDCAICFAITVVSLLLQIIIKIHRCIQKMVVIVIDVFIILIILTLESPSPSICFIAVNLHELFVNLGT